MKLFGSLADLLAARRAGEAALSLTFCLLSQATDNIIRRLMKLAVLTAIVPAVLAVTGGE